MKNVIYLFLLMCCSISFCQNQKLRTTALNTKELENNTYIGFDGLGNNYYINNNVFYRKSATVFIDNFMFSTFFGGNDESWATPNDTYITFSNFSIFE